MSSCEETLNIYISFIFLPVSNKQHIWCESITNEKTIVIKALRQQGLQVKPESAFHPPEPVVSWRPEAITHLRPSPAGAQTDQRAGLDGRVTDGGGLKGAKQSLDNSE